MEEKNTLKKYLEGLNPWWGNEKFRFNTIPRQRYSYILEKNPSRLINILIGARRVGKTSLLHSFIDQLLENNRSRTIIYLPADLEEIQELGIKKVLEIITDDFNFDILNKKIFVFIDEVQEIEGWQKDIKFLYDNTKIQFFLTGSSSLILKKETSKLSGRFLLHHILSLNYIEFLDFKKQKHSKKTLFEYLEGGGYPEYVLNGSWHYLQQAVESTLYRDLLEVYGVRNPSILTNLLKYLADKMTNPVSAYRIGLDLKIDDKTASFYLQYLESVYLIYPVHRYASSNKIMKGSLPKYYFNDNGVLNLFGAIGRIGHLVENVVFLELLSRDISEVKNIFYDITNGFEVDFRFKDVLYEVKARELSKEDLLKYEGFEGLINVVCLEKNKEKLLPNIQPIYLKDFLLKKN